MIDRTPHGEARTMIAPGLILGGPALTGQVIPFSSSPAYLTSQQPAATGRASRPTAGGPRAEVPGMAALGLALILVLVVGCAGARRRADAP